MKATACFVILASVCLLVSGIVLSSCSGLRPTTRPSGAAPTTRPAPPKLTAEQTVQVRLWIKQLGSGDFQERVAAQAALKRFGPGALPFVRAAVDSEDAEVASRAEQILPFLEQALRWHLYDVRRKPMKLDLGAGGTMRFVRIPAGTFRMGSGLSAEQTARKYGGKAEYFKNEHPQHTVKLTKAFYMGVTEVTQAQWKAMMGTTPWSGKEYARDGADNAVSYVRWNNVTAFCKKMSARTGRAIRLPTEAEWEYACRAGSTTGYHFGGDASELGRYAWYRGNAYDKDEKYVHAVGRKQPNGWGLYDMHGNVWEWCQDWYAKDYPSTMQTDPKGPASGGYRVLRGGSWKHSPVYCRSASRGWITPGLRYSNYGFRVVLVAGGLD